MFEDTKAVAFALDGTVYRGSKLIDGIDEVIRHCRKLGKSVFFLTNNSSRGVEGFTSSSRSTFFTGNTWLMGSTPSVSSVFSTSI